MQQLLFMIRFHIQMSLLYICTALILNYPVEHEVPKYDKVHYFIMSNNNMY